MGFGAVAGAVSVLVSHPIDTVKSNVQSLGASKQFSGVFDCAAKIIATQGLAGLFNGIGPRFFRVSMEIGLHFTLYEQYGRWLDKRFSVSEDCKE